MKARRALHLAWDELRAFRRSARTAGGRSALVDRVRHQLDLDQVDSAAIAALRADLDEARGALDEARAELRRLADRAGHLETGLGDHAGAIVSLRTDATAGFVQVDKALRRIEFQGRIAPLTAWLASIPMASATRISVVTPSRDRSALLMRAIGSVQAQVHDAWEHLVVDNGSEDGTPALLDRLAEADPRLVVLRQPTGMAAASRNAALARATGDVVCYLDDDNVMQPLWLKAVAWAFDRQPDVEVLYGAIVREPPAEAGPEAGLPHLLFEPFDRHELERANFVDIGVIAHRRGLEGAWFDETLPSLHDWDLALRLTEERAPMALPVVAAAYTASAPGRISASRAQDEAYDRIRARFPRTEEGPPASRRPEGAPAP